MNHCRVLSRSLATVGTRRVPEAAGAAAAEPTSSCASRSNAPHFVNTWNTSRRRNSGSHNHLQLQQRRWVSQSVRWRSGGDAGASGQLPDLAERLEALHNAAHAALSSDVVDLESASRYYFDGKGKLFRPMLVIATGRACRTVPAGMASSEWMHDQVAKDQETIALITEMIHTASLVHDDVIDEATTRRGKVAINKVYRGRECALAGDFILASATQLLAGLGNVRVIEIFAQVIEDLVRGELMQLGTAAEPEKRFKNYMQKTEAKTASLLARSCHSVAVLADGGAAIENAAYEYGRHLGIAFQLVDDVLDVVQDAEAMGKETSVDMQLGLATAPVLFASEQYPELVPIILRRFKQDGDAQLANELIMQSDGIERTKELALDHHRLAVQFAEQLPGEAYKPHLIQLADKVLSRSS